jgi:hypothetical protein
VLVDEKAKLIAEMPIPISKDTNAILGTTGGGALADPPVAVGWSREGVGFVDQHRGPRSLVPIEGFECQSAKSIVAIPTGGFLVQSKTDNIEMMLRALTPTAS